MSWMAWTQPTALFFICIAVSLVILTVLELYRPAQLKQGFLPIATTRGDRFFIGLLSSAFIHLLWLGVVGLNLWMVSLLCLIWVAVLLRWG